MKIYIRTFGCQMNERDSEWVTGLLIDKGFEIVDSANKADVIIFNTCSVRKHAEHRAISNMGALAKLKKESPGAVFCFMGCAAEYHGKALFNKLPCLDIVCGTGNIHRLPDLIEKAMKKRERQLAVGRLSEHLPEISPLYRNNKAHAFVSISRGCDNYCSYCIVPYVRGPERSRRPEDIINEIKALLKDGHSDITLLGQNVNSYGKDLAEGVDFIELLKTIDRIDGKKCISFFTSHPKDVSTELFDAIRDLDSVSKRLHLPVQSGSDKILKMMNRGYDLKYYLDMVEYFKKVVPDGVLTTDFIVGFPGETDEDFMATKELLRSVEFSVSFIFKYSPRPPAASSRMPDDVGRAVKEARHRELLDIQRFISNRNGRRRLKAQSV